jgi:O-antigen/teichoic acid export membrane protein
LSSQINLTSGRLLARNTIINLLGQAAPFAVAIFTIPMLVHGLGVDRYGILTLSMIVVGYMGLFDFGLGAAATKLIPEAVAAGDSAAVPDLFWTSLSMMLAFGAVAAVLIAVPAPWLVIHVLKIPAGLQFESVHAFYLLAFSMLFVISGGSLGGTLSAYQRFDLINAVGVPGGIFSYAAPLLVLPFSHSLAWMVAVVVLTRAVSWVATFALCLRIVPALRTDLRPRRSAIRPMLSFGGWVTVSSAVGPIMDYFDRFIIGAILSVAAVAYYSVPSQITSKLRLFPAALSGVVFAAFSGSFARNPDRTVILFERSARYVLLVMFAPALLLVALAPEGLTLWLGRDFAAHGAGVLRWLTAAMLLNGIAYIPYVLVQAAHRPDLTAKFHLAEVPFFLAMLFWMLPRYGVEGAAIAWTLRAGADALALLVAVGVLLPAAQRAAVRVGLLTALALTVLWLVAQPAALQLRLTLTGAALAIFVGAGWTMLLDSYERKFVRSSLNPLRIFAV